jgi:hypothetical protein
MSPWSKYDKYSNYFTQHFLPLVSIAPYKGIGDHLIINAFLNL